MFIFEKVVLNLNIKQKIIFIVMSSIALSLTTSIILFSIYERESYIQSMIEELNILSDVISKRSSAALLFRDEQVATANLESLSAKKNIIIACIYDKKEKRFSHFFRDNNKSDYCPLLPYNGDESYTEINDDTSILVKPIVFAGKSIGWVYIETSMNWLNERMQKLMVLAVFICMIATIVTFLFAMRVQRYISQPMINLQHVLRTITKSRDYSLRAKKVSTDEFGNLVDDFNRMLHMVQEANLRLSDAVEEIKSQKEESDDKAVGAEERTTAIKDFFAGVSHDLKQPLSAINLFLGVLENEKSEDKKKVYISKIMESSNNLNTLFDELLDMSRIDQIMNDINLSRVYLPDLISKIVKDFDVMANDKNLTLRTRCPDLYVYSDPTMLERIIRNLLANAVRYTNLGGILIACRVKKDNVSIEIWDTGVGIPADKQESIFGQYTQLNNPNQESVNGFGLGLSIVSRLTNALGHKLSLFSRDGQGTVFKLDVPLLREARKAKDFITSIENSGHIFGRSAIIIDDEKNIAEAMLATAIAWDLEAEAVCSIEDLKRLLPTLKKAPDIVITDFTLSETETGLMALELIEEHFDTPIAAIVVTGEKDPEILKEIEYTGCHYLPKPVNLHLLKEKVDSVLSHKPYY